MNGICDTSKTVGFVFYRYHRQIFVADIVSKRQQASTSEADYITRLISEAIDIWHISTSQLVNDEYLIQAVLYGDDTNDLQCGVRMTLNGDYMVEVGYTSPNGNIILRAKYDNCVIDWRLDNLTTTTSEAWLILQHIYENSPF